jgi:hypothetical protein
LSRPRPSAKLAVTGERGVTARRAADTLSTTAHTPTVTAAPDVTGSAA